MDVALGQSWEGWLANRQLKVRQRLAGEQEIITRTMGVWPAPAHNSAFKRNQLLPGRSGYLSLKGVDARLDLYAAVGALQKPFHVFGKVTDQGVLVGGNNKEDACSLVWRFDVPPYLKVVGGQVQARISGNGDLSKAFMGIGTAFTPKGGGAFWKGFIGYETTGYRLESFNRDEESSDWFAALTFPPGAESYYLTINRPVGMTESILLKDIRIEPTFDREESILINVERAEPVWTADEAISFNISTRGLTDHLVWQLSDNGGDVLESGKLPLEDGERNLDLILQSYILLCEGSCVGG